jgi:hypothetical protein
VLQKFHLAHYRLTLEALEPLDLPPFKGSALRGGFGHTFKRLVCFQPKQCDEHCSLGNTCPYGYIFETAPPEGSDVLRTLDEVPRPFVIEPPDDRRTLIPPGERLAFGLTLVGRAVNYLPYFILVFRELGQAGLGRRRGKYRLAAIDAITPSPCQGEGRGGGQSIYRAEDDTIRASDTSFGWEVVAARAAALPADRLTLDFLTPARLKHAGRWAQSGPPFHVLVKALLGRVSSLSYFHCGQRWEADFRGLIDRAMNVRAVQAQTRWEDWSRFSGRQEQRIEMGGLVGRITYAGDLTDYLPLLALGEWVHAGKGTVFGNGQYRIADDVGRNREQR